MDEKEFQAALKYIYGDAQMDSKLMQQMQYLRKTNPELLRSYAKQKRNEAYNPPGGSAPAYQTPRFSVAAPSKADKIERRSPSPKELMESRFDAGDFSGLSDFGTAFNEAKKRGREEFNWRSTKANPSGRFTTAVKSANDADELFDESDYWGEEPVIERVPIDKSKLNVSSLERRLFEPVPDTTGPTRPQIMRMRMTDEANKISEQSMRTLLDNINARNAEKMKEIERLEQEDIYTRQRDRQARKDFERVHGYTPRWGKAVAYQQGGAMGVNDQELQKAFMAFLIEDAAAQGMQIQSEQDLQAYAQQLGEEGLKAKYQEFMQKMQGGVKAALGAKLNYINKLKGNCPSGTESYYFREGGSIKRGCKPCMEKAKEGKKFNKMNEVEKFKAAKGCKAKKK